MLSVSSDLVDFVDRLRFPHIPDSTRNEAKLHILDALGTSLLSSRLDKAKRIVTALSKAATEGGCALWGYGFRASPSVAAMVNGMLAEGLDYSDIHVRAGLHPTCVVLPAVFALSELTGSSGAELLTAYLGGCEIMIRLGLAAPGRFHERGFQPTSIIGTLASAMAAGKILRLSKKKLINALSIASTMAFGSSLSVRVGAYLGGIDTGRTSESGILSALLAGAGVTGIAEDSLEGKFGFLDTHAGHSRYDAKVIVSRLGQRWEYDVTFLKRYPTSYACTFALDAALRIRDSRRFNPATIKTLRFCEKRGNLELFGMPFSQKKAPRDVYEAKTSFSYLLSLALIHGEVSLDSISHGLRDKQVVRLARRVVSVPDERSHWVEVELVDGTRIREKQDDLVQTPRKGVLDKFQSNAQRIVGKNKTERLKSLVMSLESLKNVRELAELLS